jgi:Protein of unknown function (DUF3305)
MIKSAIDVGVVIERRPADSEWIDHTWHAVAVLPGAPAVDHWVELEREGEYARYHAATLPLEIFRSETEGYKYNLTLDQPMVFVVIDPEPEGENPIEVSLATVCPYEAQDYLDGSEVLVEPVPMPVSIAAWLAEFVEKHHVDVPFKKRKRTPHPDKARSDDPASGEAPNELIMPRPPRGGRV